MTVVQQEIEYALDGLRQLLKTANADVHPQYRPHMMALYLQALATLRVAEVLDTQLGELVRGPHASERVLALIERARMGLDAAALVVPAKET